MTVQDPETIILEGEVCALRYPVGMPQDNSVSKLRELSEEELENAVNAEYEKYERARKVAANDPGGSAKVDMSKFRRLGLFSTSCWRRYKGVWEVRDGRLFLVDIVGRYSLESGEPLLAKWVSQDLVVPIGKRLGYEGGIVPIFEKKRVITVSEGIVVSDVTVEDSLES